MRHNKEERNKGRLGDKNGKGIERDKNKITVKEKIREEFWTARRGVRQGCPLVHSLSIF